jgi:uncharacterized protein
MTEMKLTKEYIDSLKYESNKIVDQIASEQSIPNKSVLTTIQLLSEENTIPFISRYRKEMTGALDEVQIRDIQSRHKYLETLETKKIEAIKKIFEQDKLTPSLFENIRKASTQTELDDLYAPYKKKKKTRGMLAKEKGLDGLASYIQKNDVDRIMLEAEKYISSEKGVDSVELAIQGAQDIIAEQISEDLSNKRVVSKYMNSQGLLTIKGLKEAEKSKYRMYYDFKEKIKTLPEHRILAINRGEKEKELRVRFEFSEVEINKLLITKYRPGNKIYEEAIIDSMKRLIIPSVQREVRHDLTERSELKAIDIFQKNSVQLLMQPPIKQTRLLGIDPGIRTGSKAAAIDSSGKFLGHFVFDQKKESESIQLLKTKIKEYNVQLVAIGNGTGSQDVQKIVAEAIKSASLDSAFTVVDEDGASVYSASDIAREEFPDLDLTIRGAISIARRIQDPLSELVKIDPKSIGVGLYQHDVDQKLLTEKLNETVESVVNRIGVNVNTTSWPLLKHISGISTTIAKNIIKHRDTQGAFESRADFTKVKSLGPKVFEQAAGFLRVPNSPNVLDNSWVHPENYKAGKEIYEILNSPGSFDNEHKQQIMEKYQIGLETVEDIISSLQKPDFDPREDFPSAMIQKDVLLFDDLKEGMQLEGKVKNVVNFGAFIDLGIKEAGLLHISEMSNEFVKDPFQIVQVGDIVTVKIKEIDQVRKRIQLSMK